MKRARGGGSPRITGLTHKYHRARKSAGQTCTGTHQRKSHQGEGSGHLLALHLKATLNRHLQGKGKWVFSHGVSLGIAFTA